MTKKLKQQLKSKFFKSYILNLNKVIHQYVFSYNTMTVSSEEALTNQFLKLKMLENKIDFSKQINEISLNFDELEALDLSSEKTLVNERYKFDVKLTSIEINTFTEFTNLRSLNLFNNKITSIQAYTFQQLSSLENLWLNNNLINEIDNKSVQRTT